jgi:hypothetical protein
MLSNIVANDLTHISVRAENGQIISIMGISHHPHHMGISLDPHRMGISHHVLQLSTTIK